VAGPNRFSVAAINSRNEGGRVKVKSIAVNK